MTELVFRTPTLQDSDKLSDLITQLGYPITPELMRKRLETYLASNCNYAILAISDDNVVGLASFTIIDCFHMDRKFARITSLVVDEHQRNHGIGKALIKHAEKIINSAGCTSIEVSSNINRAASGTHDFYSSAGYNDVRAEIVYFRKTTT
ncbi:MAG: GNAT family N-acetyltransferase [Negativicutes bacterium]|jgi:ribosomal protein S18 acetylase RimI-like enzyme